MAKKGVLGKGLSALIPEDISIDINDKIIEVDIDEVFPNKTQPRKNFDREKIDLLKESIKEHGIINPIIVKKEGDFYKVVAGERRWRAAKKLGLKKIPIIQKSLSEREVAEISLIENIQREDLNPIEEALAYKRLSEDFKLTQEEISKKVGRSRVAITNSMRLLTLHKDVIEFIIDKSLTEGHGKVIAGIEDKETQFKISNKVIEEELNVRQTEKLVKEMNIKKSNTKEYNSKDVHTKVTEEKLQSILGAKVNISKGKKKNKIEIEFYTEEDLNRILDIISSK